MRILLLADLHIGSIKDTQYYYNVMKNIIDKEIIFTHTDAVIILGDYFDRLFKANEIYVSLAVNVMSYLVRACSREKTKIRLIYGTESHEMEQYKLFNHHFTSKKNDIKLISSVTKEELFKNINVLYLPEEYIDDKHEFYKNYLYSDKKYDFIFGHGVIVEGMPSEKFIKINPDNKEKKVPRFNSGELSKVSDICVFGHQHTHVDIGNNVYYLGSLFRNQFGEEEDKVYGIIEDKEIRFIKNEDAYIFKTYEYDSDNKIYDSLDNIIDEIKRIENENKNIILGTQYGKIRLLFHLKEDKDNVFKENIKNALFNNKIISSLIKEEVNLVTEEGDQLVEDEYSFILDKNMDVIDKIYTYINKQYEEEPMTLKQLNKYINDPLII